MHNCISGRLMQNYTWHHVTQIFASLVLKTFHIYFSGKNPPLAAWCIIASLAPGCKITLCISHTAFPIQPFHTNIQCKKSTSGSIRLNCISPKIKPCIADTAFCIFSRLLHWNPLTYIRCKIAPLHCMDPSLNITPWTVLSMTHCSTHIWLCATSVLHTLNGCMRVMSRYWISIVSSRRKQHIGRWTRFQTAATHVYFASRSCGIIPTIQDDTNHPRYHQPSEIIPTTIWVKDVLEFDRRIACQVSGHSFFLSRQQFWHN